MQNTMLDSTISCIPSTINFVCDVDGVHTEIPIPSSAWDVENETVWLTQVQLAELYRSSVQNVGHHIGNILEDEELPADSVIKESFITATDGKSYRTKQYNIEMLIALGYRIKSKVATKFRQWATKHLKELMTKGHTEIETQPQHQFTIPKTFPEALRAYADEVERREAAERRAITAEAELTSEKEAHEKDNEDFRNGFDIVNAQKAQIGSTREATAMATASAKSRECKRLTVENAELKDAVGRGTNWHTVSMMTAEWKRDFGHAPSCHKLKKFSADLPKDMQPVKDVEVKVVLRNGSDKLSKVYRYHREAWAKYREYEENSRATDKNAPDTKILGSRVTDTDLEVF